MATKAIEHLYLLKEMGEGLLCSLYLTKSQLQYKSKTNHAIMKLYVEDDAYLKLRHRLGKAFPKVAELSSTIPGYSRFDKDAGFIIRFFLRFKHDVHSLIDFKEAALALLLSFPSLIREFDMEKNRNLCLLYMELFNVYIRVVHLFATCDQAKVMYTLNFNAEKIYKTRDQPGDVPDEDILHGATQRRPTMFPSGNPNAPIQGSVIPLDTIYSDGDLVYAQKASVLFSDLFDDLPKSLINTFEPIKSALCTLTRQISLSINTAHDIRYLVETRALNPSHMGDEISLPDCPKLSSNSTLCLYDEIAEYENYSDFMCFAVLASPSVLFDEAVLSTFSRIATSNLVMRLFRDIILNIHVELEIALNIFQPAGLPGAVKKAMGKPRGLKLKKLAREWSQRALRSEQGTAQATKSTQMDTPGNAHDEELAHPKHPSEPYPCYEHHRAVRALIAIELESMVKILEISPGLTAPRLPQIIALASLTKSAIFCYFRHALQSSLKTRRDCRGLYQHSHYYHSDPTVTILLHGLFQLIKALQESKHVIADYYAEFLGNVDSVAVDSLISSLGQQSPDLLTKYLPTLSTFAPTLRLAIDSDPTVTHTTTQTAFSRSSVNESRAGRRGSLRDAIKQDHEQGIFATFGGSLSRESIIFSKRSSIEVAMEVNQSVPRAQSARLSTSYIVETRSAEVEVMSSTVHANENVDYFPLRLNFDRLMLAVHSPALASITALPSLQQLCYKLQRVCSRTKYVDHLACTLTLYFEPAELVWYQRSRDESSDHNDSYNHHPNQPHKRPDPLIHAFKTALHSKESSELTSKALVFLCIPLLVGRNVHVDCPGEWKLVTGDSIR